MKAILELDAPMNCGECLLKICIPSIGMGENAMDLWLCLPTRNNVVSYKNNRHRSCPLMFECQYNKRKLRQCPICGKFAVSEYNNFCGDCGTRLYSDLKEDTE
jgi:hypothetical protein